MTARDLHTRGVERADLVRSKGIELSRSRDIGIVARRSAAFGTAEAPLERGALRT